MRKQMLLRTLITTSLLLMTGCDIPGLGPDPRIAKKEADAKAIGSACRHGLRGLEDCYKQNEEASKSDIFTGWKDMDQYMRENKIEGVPIPMAKVAPVEEIIEPTKAKGDTKVDTKAKPGTENKEKPVTAKPVPTEKPGTKAAVGAAAASHDKAPAAVAGKAPAAAPAKAAAKEAPSSH